MRFTFTLLALAASTLARPVRRDGAPASDQCATAKPTLQSYFDTNKLWANAQTPETLAKLAAGQNPDLLWIGCGDSRVPESVVMARKPGEVFTHRNIANQFHPDDDSANAVLHYAVLEVGVSHVAVVGHTSCGGAKAALAANTTDDTTHLGRFLKPLIELKATIEGEVTLDALIHANVQAQIENVVASPTIQTAWGEGKNVSVHGWLFHLDTGLLEDLGMSQSL